jgi:hypothetical protein
MSRENAERNDVKREREQVDDRLEEHVDDAEHNCKYDGADKRYVDSRYEVGRNEYGDCGDEPMDEGHEVTLMDNPFSIANYGVFKAGTVHNPPRAVYLEN